ncbi:hypothetical protein NMQ14_12925 [Methyloversatilis sp. XJ19-13]|uniref:hypothetical protein n=1 Tax=Methyloversatilis sp. XJ19-13 TaxID=2963430 RepID=UPI00211C4B9E|nr:hypothetical protein [Methyloversatilis sp. XJ19-13]MCQ9375155.1 hypothetical protein [Methyloversatilis sp. XJ19-13]
MSNYTIVQIIPAEGWDAVFEDEGKTFFRPLVCFALTTTGDDEKPADEQVKPMYYADTGIDFCENTGNFIGIGRRGTGMVE